MGALIPDGDKLYILLISFWKLHENEENSFEDGGGGVGGRPKGVYVDPPVLTHEQP